MCFSQNAFAANNPTSTYSRALCEGKSGQMESQSVRNFHKIWANVWVAARVGKFVGPKCESPVNAELRGGGVPTKWE